MVAPICCRTCPSWTRCIRQHGGRRLLGHHPECSAGVPVSPLGRSGQRRMRNDPHDGCSRVGCVWHGRSRCNKTPECASSECRVVPVHVALSWLRYPFLAELDTMSQKDRRVPRQHMVVTAAAGDPLAAVARRGAAARAAKRAVDAHHRRLGQPRRAVGALGVPAGRRCVGVADAGAA